MPKFLDVPPPKTAPIFDRFTDEWLLELEELKTSPSIKDGYTFNQEWNERTTTIQFILTAANKLNLPPATSHTACVYFHRFFTRWSLKLYTPSFAVSACLFVACKHCDTSMKLEHIVKHVEVLNHHYKRQVPPEFTPDKLHELCSLALRYERQLLYTLAFKTEVKHPSTIIAEFIKDTPLNRKSDPKRKFVSICNKFLHDSYQTPLCLLYPPEFIAATCIFLAVSYTKGSFEDIGGPSWFTTLHPELNRHDLDRASVILLKLYEQSS
ncbi:hypothetical protein P9112_008656 [Eukaryota sp. TZLM1-RC]